MDIKNLLEKIYKLFLISGVLEKDSNMDIGIQIAIENKQYEKAIKLFIYTLMDEINNRPIYTEIRQKEINICIFLLMIIDTTGIDNLVIEEFINLIIELYNYILNNKIDFITNKEKKEMVKFKLREISYLMEF